jgi:hypothetical protein
MSEFIQGVVIDMHAGRETWRVRFALMIPAMLAAVTLALARLP